MIDVVSITVTNRLGEKVYFPEISFFCNGSEVCVFTMVKRKSESENGWSPEEIKKAIGILTPSIPWEWEIDLDISRFEWSLFGCHELIVVGSKLCVSW